MPSTADPVKLGQLVEDLYAKKKWLDRVITSLESAIDSPDYRLIAALTDAFERAEKGAEKIDFQQLQHGRIEKLAADVSRRKNGQEAAHDAAAGPQLNGISAASSRANKDVRRCGAPGLSEKHHFE
jgi:type II secretory pathway component HofQ